MLTDDFSDDVFNAFSYWLLFILDPTTMFKWHLMTFILLEIEH